MEASVLHLDNTYSFFSDGVRFVPGLLVVDDLMDGIRLDKLHLQATATYEPMQIHMSKDCWEDTVVVGEPADPHKRVTVEELLNAINDWCDQPASWDGLCKMEEYLMSRSRNPVWGGLHVLGFDAKTQRMAYELLH